MSKSVFAQTLREMGATDNEVTKALDIRFAEVATDEMPEIQPGNVIIVQLFFVVCKYWERVGMEATPICLDPLKVEARANRLTWYKQLDDNAMELLWHGLDVMEQACLLAWSQQRKQQSNK